jgi:hypothetical protein
MTYHVSWLGTVLMVVLGIVLGNVSGLFISGRWPVTIWAGLVGAVFAVAAAASVVTGYSWMFNDAIRGLWQQITIAALITGLTFSPRSNG